MIVKCTSSRTADKARKNLHVVFQQLGLKITAELNHQVVNFLDITLNLHDGKFSPYRKPNNDPLYVDSRSNHPPATLKQIPSSINKRVVSLSSDQRSFEACKPYYDRALERSNYNVSLLYTNGKLTNTPSTKRKR